MLPVDSVAEYFEHFPILEIDSTFYRLLLDQNGQPTQNYQVLKTYARHLKEGDRIILKVPQLITAQKTHRGDRHNENSSYLNPKIFTDQFYDPAAKLLGAHLAGFIFEQEYQRKEDRAPVNAMAQSLDKFFSQISKDSRYHLELRTDLYLRDQIFAVLAKHGVGVISQEVTINGGRDGVMKVDKFFFRVESNPRAWAGDGGGGYRPDAQGVIPH